MRKFGPFILTRAPCVVLVLGQKQAAKYPWIKGSALTKHHVYSAAGGKPEVHRGLCLLNIRPRYMCTSGFCVERKWARAQRRNKLSSKVCDSKVTCTPLLHHQCFRWRTEQHRHVLSEDDGYKLCQHRLQEWTAPVTKTTLLQNPLLTFISVCNEVTKRRNSVKQRNKP